MNPFLHEEAASAQTEGLGNPERSFGDKIKMWDLLHTLPKNSKIRAGACHVG